MEVIPLNKRYPMPGMGRAVDLKGSLSILKAYAEAVRPELQAGRYVRYSVNRLNPLAPRFVDILSTPPQSALPLHTATDVNIPPEERKPAPNPEPESEPQLNPELESAANSDASAKMSFVFSLAAHSLPEQSRSSCAGQESFENCLPCECCADCEPCAEEAPKKPTQKHPGMRLKPAAPEHSLLCWKNMWFRRDAGLQVNGEVISGVPISIKCGTLRVINGEHSYYVPFDKIDFIKTDDGLESSFCSN